MCQADPIPRDTLDGSSRGEAAISSSGVTGSEGASSKENSYTFYVAYLKRTDDEVCFGTLLVECRPALHEKWRGAQNCQHKLLAHSHQRKLQASRWLNNGRVNNNSDIQADLGRALLLDNEKRAITPINLRDKLRKMNAPEADRLVAEESPPPTGGDGAQSLASQTGVQSRQSDERKSDESWNWGSQNWWNWWEAEERYNAYVRPGKRPVQTQPKRSSWQWVVSILVGSTWRVVDRSTAMGVGPRPDSVD